MFRLHLSSQAPVPLEPRLGARLLQMLLQNVPANECDSLRSAEEGVDRVYSHVVNEDLQTIPSGHPDFQPARAA